jgi:hypothetical protein
MTAPIASAAGFLLAAGERFASARAHQPTADRRLAFCLTSMQAAGHPLSGTPAPGGEGPEAADG